MVVDRRKRDQLNISLASDSPIVRKLQEAEQITGRPRAQIARAVLSTFLDTWLQVEQTRQRMVDAAKAATQAEGAAAVSLRDLGTLPPPYRGDEYRPEPDYWRVVESRRPMPRRVIGQYPNVPVRNVIRQRPPVRSVEADQSSLDDPAGAGD